MWVTPQGSRDIYLLRWGFPLFWTFAGQMSTIFADVNTHQRWLGRVEANLFTTLRFFAACLIYCSCWVWLRVPHFFSALRVRRSSVQSITQRENKTTTWMNSSGRLGRANKHLDISAVVLLQLASWSILSLLPLVSILHNTINDTPQ